MHEVISAFLDNEPFDAQELSAVLATQEGRDLLIDLIALRSVVQPSEQAPAVSAGRRPLWMWASAAAVLFALISGYQFGRASDDGPTPSLGGTIAITAPEPTNVLKFEPGVNWSESVRNGGG